MDEQTSADLKDCLTKADALGKETRELKEENDALRQGARAFKALAERLSNRLGRFDGRLKSP